jgi:hypothetical protein
MHELGHLVLIEDAARLLSVRVDRCHREFCELGSRHFYEIQIVGTLTISRAGAGRRPSG